MGRWWGTCFWVARRSGRRLPPLRAATRAALSSKGVLWLFRVVIVFLLAGCGLLGDPAAFSPPTITPVPMAENTDKRAYQHGIDFLTLPDGTYTLIWASSGEPPAGPLPSGNWTHDIYYAPIDPQQPAIRPVLLIANPEAQEPASAAISSDGHILITMEDGWNTGREVAQRYGVYDAALNPILPYPQLIADGGHSGHVTASGARFVVFYAEGWVDGGGVDGLGSGDDVRVAVYDSEGVLEHRLEVAVGEESRDWWPLAAGSPERVLLLWQRFVPQETYSRLMFALLDAEAGRLVVDAVMLEEAVQYYTYDAVFVPSLNRFLVTGAQLGGVGFACLLDEEGKVVAFKTGLPAPVRESQIILRDGIGETLAAQPVAPSGIMVLRLRPENIQLKYRLGDDYVWESSGVDGIFLSPDTLYLVATSPAGLVEKTVILP